MTTGLIIMFTIFGLLIITGYVGAWVHDSFEKRVPFVVLSLFVGLFLLGITVMLTFELSTVSKQLKSGCPEYEIVSDTLYILK